MDQHKRNEEPLTSWKEIGAYIGRNDATARRWERTEGLPVHRHTHKRRASVYAYPSEIDVWRASRKALPEPSPLWKTLLIGPRSLVFGSALALFLVMVGNGVQPQVASAQDSGKGPRQIWLPGDGERPSPFSLSADGRYSTFTDGATGDLGVRDLTTNSTRRLTNTKNWEAYAERSVISPDGRMIAYSWLSDSQKVTELRLIPISGGAPRTIHRTEGMQDYMNPFGWTPDGKQILVLHFLADRTKQIAMVSVADGSVRVLKSAWWMGIGDQLRLSPDGRWIAYSARAQGQISDRDVAVLASDGKRETLIDGPADDSEPFWSADGAHLLFLSNRTGNVSLWTVPFENGKAAGTPMLVKTDMTRLRPLGFARNGAFFYVRTGQGNSNINVAQLDRVGRNLQPLGMAINTYVAANQGPRLSPDGQFLAYYSLRPQMALVIRTLKTGEERVVPTEVSPAILHDYGPMWFPDRRSVLVAATAPSPGGYRVDLETGKAELVWALQRPIEMYTLAPDGKAIYYTEPVSGNQNQFVTTRLLRYKIATRRATELKSGEWIMSPAPSPDGKQLAYMVTLPSTDEGYLAVMPADGGNSRELFRGPWAGTSRPNSIAWSPDQRYIYFVTGGPVPDRPNTLWRVPAAGGAVERVIDLGSGLVRSPQVTDGRIFFSVNTLTSNELWTERDLPTNPAVPE